LCVADTLLVTVYCLVSVESIEYGAER
jgi:hypothetical protein